MLSTEIKINGIMIIHIYARNIGDENSKGNKYYYEVYEVESRKVKSGEIYHCRKDGATVLISKIINDYKK